MTVSPIKVSIGITPDVDGSASRSAGPIIFVSWRHALIVGFFYTYEKFLRDQYILRIIVNTRKTITLYCSKILSTLPDSDAPQRVFTGITILKFILINPSNVGYFASCFWTGSLGLTFAEK